MKNNITITTVLFFFYFTLFAFTTVNAQSFTPDPNKTYYLDVPVHNLRLASTGESEDAFTTSTNDTGANVEWKFIAKGNGFWHIQRAAGGSTPRLRTDNTSFADMQKTNNAGINTYYRFDSGNSSGTHYITLPDGPANFQRLRMTPSGEIKFVTTASGGSWVSWRITEVPSNNSGSQCQCASGANSLLVNGSFEETSNPAYNSAYDLIEAIGKLHNASGVKFVDRHTDTDFPGWFTTGGIFNPDSGNTSVGGTLELGQSGFLGFESPDGDVYAELDGNHHNQDISVTPGQVLDWELSHRGRPGTDEITVTAGPVGNQTVVAVLTSPNTAWIRHTGQYVVPSGVTQIRFTISPTGAENDDLDSSNLLDNVKVCPANGVATCNPTNIAVGKTTQQSSTWANNNSQFGSGNAVDGNKNGNHNNNSISHTTFQQNAWWEIDLGEVYDLSAVKLWNRTSCCADRLTDFHVLVSTLPFNSQDLNETINQGAVSDYHFPGTAGRETDINLNRIGRYLRVQLSGNNALQLAEVEIMGCPINTSLTATLYSNCNYNGNVISLGIGEYPNMPALGFSNNDLSSFQIPAGLQVTLFNNTNFGGSSITFTSDDNCLVNNSVDDFTSSLIIEPLGAAARAINNELILSPVFGQKTGLQWYVNQNEDKIIKEYIVKHGTDEYKELNVIVTVPATDVIGLERYDLLHETPKVGINFYQIVVEYEDGSIDYPMYEDIMFKEVPASPIHIAPNPATDFLNIDLSNYMDESISYTIQSINGVGIQNGKWDIDHNDTVQLDVSKIQNGLYIIYMKPENHRAVAVKFILAKDY